MIKKLMVMCVVALAMFYTYGNTAKVNGITWYYTVSNGKAMIYRGKNGSAIPQSTIGSIVVPSKVSNYTVVSIGDYAFYNCDNITSVTIPQSVTNIGSRAFYDCRGLISVKIPISVRSIGDWAFYQCSGLTSVTISEGVRSIGDWAFSYCSGLASVKILGSVTTMGKNAFYNCSGLTSITISEGVRSIGEDAFSSCSGLTSVKIPSSVTSIGDWAFNSCSGLTSITISEGVRSIGEHAFSFCSGLTSVKIPSSVTSIGESAFSSCSGLTHITIPSSVTSIGSLAFILCPLTDVTVPGHRCGIDFSSVTNLVISDGTTAIGSRAFYNCSALTSVKIPSSVTSIGESAFSSCSGLTHISIPSSVTTIGENAFASCHSLTHVSIPSSVTSIGEYAFYSCYRLTHISIPSSVTTIGENAFASCYSLTHISIPCSVTSIGSGAFNMCQLTDVTVPGHKCGIDFSSVTNLVISDGVISIEKESFCYCDSILSVTVPKSVNNIEGSAFSGCSSLSTILFEGNAPTVGGSFFSGVDASCVARVSRKTSGWTVDAEGRWNGLILEYIESKDGLKDFVDSKLSKYIKDEESYIAFWSWATGLKGVSFDQIKTSPNAWFSYALDLPVLIEGEISEERLRVRSFEPMEDNHFTIRFGLDSVDTGDNAEVGNIVRSFAVEGSQSLEDDSFSVTNVAVDPALPEDGAVTFAVAPRVDSDSFFFRTRLLDGKNDIGMNGCSISLDSGNGGVLPNGVSSQIYVPYTEEYGTLPIPTREGYKFLGWFTALEGGEKVDAESKTGFVSSKTLYAHWQINTYTVSLNANGGIGGTTVSRTHGVTLGSLPTLIREGYTFAGWWTAASGGTQVTASTVVTADMQLYAHWTIKSYTVVFDANGGSGGVSKSYNHGSTLGELPVPTREGFAFVGWFTAVSGGTQVTASTVVTADTTLHAHWTIKSYTVVFDANGGSGGVSKSYNYGSTLGELPVPTREGYAFVGWFTAVSGSTQVTASTVVTADITLYAHWTIKSYTVMFDANGGSGGVFKSYNHGSTLGELPVPIRDGYVFVGWFTAASGGTQVTASTVVTKSQTLYAQWEEELSTSLSKALDMVGSEVMVGGNMEWFRQNDVSHDAVDAAQSGDISHSQTSWMQVEVKNASSVSFWWKVSSESNYDKLHFYVDGTEVVDPISGQRDWIKVVYKLAAGSHTLKWSYTKDGSVTSGDDCGWVDQVIVTIKDSSSDDNIAPDTHDRVQLWEGGPYWATTNIGAEKPEDYGYYFWWGDTVGYKRENDKWVASDGSNSYFSFTAFSENNPPTYNKTTSELQNEGWITADGVLAPEHDAAHKHWGGDWRMPTHQELKELINWCDWTWTTMNGVNGCLVKGRGAYASKSIFLPCAGYGEGFGLYNFGSGGYCWSSVPISDSGRAAELYFDSDYCATRSSFRFNGQSIRPVQGFVK